MDPSDKPPDRPPDPRPNDPPTTGPLRSEQALSRWHRFVYPAKLAAGLVLLAVGLLGLVLPIIPGVPLLMLAIVLIAPESRIARWVVRCVHRIGDWFAHRRRRK